MELFFVLVMLAVMAKWVFPAMSAFSDSLIDEIKDVEKNGLIKTDNGAFWSPNQSQKQKQN